MNFKKLFYSLFACVVAALCWSSHNTCSASGLSPDDKFSVAEICKVDNSKAKEIIVTCPVGYRKISKGVKLTVKYHHVVKGNDMFRKIGKVKVEEMTTNGKYRCKVTDGHEEILRLFNEYPNSLFAD